MKNVDFRLLNSIAESDAKFVALYALLREKGIFTEDEYAKALEIVKTESMAETFDVIKYNMLIQDISEHGKKMTDEDEAYLRKAIAKYNPEENVDDLIEMMKFINDEEWWKNS